MRKTALLLLFCHLMAAAVYAAEPGRGARPVISYTSYFGSAEEDRGGRVAVDNAGNIYIAGSTLSREFPLINAFQAKPVTDPSDRYLTYIMKLSAKGDKLVYSTYFPESLSGFGVDGEGNAYLSCTTTRTDLPVTPGAIKPALSGARDGYIAKLSPAGDRLVYATYLGGSGGEFINSMAVDPNGNAYVVGNTASNDFPTSAGSFQTVLRGGDAFLTKLNAQGEIVYSTLFGGSGSDSAVNVAIDGSGNAYISGQTTSRDLPLSAGALITIPQTGFLAKLDNAGQERLFTTYWGEESIRLLAVDSQGNSYVAGNGFSARQDINIVLTKIDATASGVLFSTTLGGSLYEIVNHIGIDSQDNLYLLGTTLSKDIKLKRPLQNLCQCQGDDGDLLLVRFNPDGIVTFATYLGGNRDEFGNSIAIDAFDNIYISATTSSTQLNTVKPIVAERQGEYDALIIKLSSQRPRITSANITANKLILFGENFAEGAQILVNGVAQKTRNDANNPSSVLISKQAAKAVLPGQTVTLQIRNSNDVLSAPLTFTRDAQ